MNMRALIVHHMYVHNILHIIIWTWCSARRILKFYEKFNGIFLQTILYKYWQKFYSVFIIKHRKASFSYFYMRKLHSPIMFCFVRADFRRRHGTQRRRRRQPSSVVQLHFTRTCILRDRNNIKHFVFRCGSLF